MIKGAAKTTMGTHAAAYKSPDWRRLKLARLCVINSKLVAKSPANAIPKNKDCSDSTACGEISITHLNAILSQYASRLSKT
jgi:hypothetical protein